MGRYIYAVSGYFDNMHFATKQIDRFDPANRVWNYYTEASIPGLIGACSIENKLICTGEKNYLKNYKLKSQNKNHIRIQSI